MRDSLYIEGMTKRIRLPIWGVLLVMAGLLCALFAQTRLEEWQRRRQPSETMFSAMQMQDPALLRAVSLGQEGLLSSVFWVSSVFQYADQLLDREFQPHLARSLQVVVALDTLWQYPYEFAGLALEGKNHGPHPIGLEILGQGVKRFPREGRLAILYAQLLLGADWLDSAKRLDSAKKVVLPLTRSDVEAPQFARTLALTLIAKSEGGKSALRQMLFLWDGERDPMIRYAFAQKLPKLVGEATGLGGDSLALACEGMRRVLESGEQGAGRELDKVVSHMDEPEGRRRAYEVLARIGQAKP